MVFFTATDLETQIRMYAEKLDLNFTGKKMSECVEEIINICPRLHSFDEIRKYALRNLKAIEKEYGYKGLMIF